MLRMPPARTWGGPSGRFRRAAAHPLTGPLLMVVVLLAIGAQSASVYLIPSDGNDEPAHLGYVGTLAAGDLPTIDSPIVDDPERYGTMAAGLMDTDEAHQDVWTANHAPLFHLAAVPLFWLSDGEPRSVFIAMRLLNTVGFACWLLLVGLIARELLPRRPAAPVLAAIAALVPTLALRSGFLMNDGLSASGSLLTVLMTMRMMSAGVTPARVGVAALGGTIAAGTRASGVLTVALCALVLLVVLWRREGARRAITTVGVAGGVPALATGWFYLRNRALYGDFTGQDALLVKFDRDRVGSLSEIAGIPGLDDAVRTAPIVIGLLLLGVPYLLARWAAGNRARGRSLAAGLDPRWVLLALLTAATSASLVQFLAAGGGYHDRYLMPVMPLPATVIALTVLELGRRRGRPTDPERRDWLTAAVASAVLLGWLAYAVTLLEWRHIFSTHQHLPVPGPLPDLLVGIAVIAGAAIPFVLVRQYRAMASPARPRTQSAEPVL